MPSSLTNVMQTADVSTSAADFQAPGTANPGSTGKLADAGHVHPGSGSWSLGYEIVTQSITSANGFVSETVSAPTGKKVVGGGFVFTGTEDIAIDGGSNRLFMQANGPASDGSAWIFEAYVVGSGTIYAICIAA